MEILTNNPKVRDEFTKHSEYIIEYYNVDLLGILMVVRDKIHMGWKLLTHPLSGSIKPNETPYKSMALIRGDSLDFDSLSIIEDSILTVKKFQEIKVTPSWAESILDDFQVIDFDLIRKAVS